MVNKIIVDKENNIEVKDNAIELTINVEELTINIEGKVLINEIRKLTNETLNLNINLPSLPLHEVPHELRFNTSTSISCCFDLNSFFNSL